MNNYLLLNNQPENTKKVEKYMFNYIKELKIHFNLSDKQIINSLNATINKLKKEPNSKIDWLSFFKK